VSALAARGHPHLLYGYSPVASRLRRQYVICACALSQGPPPELGLGSDAELHDAVREV